MEKKKKAFSYSTYEETRADAMARATRENTNLSQVIHEFLTVYGGAANRGTVSTVEIEALKADPESPDNSSKTGSMGSNKKNKPAQLKK